MGVDVFEAMNADFLVTCGWNYRDDTTITIADAFRAHILRFSNLSPDQILVERNSRDTVGDAYFTKTRYVKPRRWASIVVVTSDYHVERTQVIFDFVFGAEARIKVLGVHTEADEATHQKERKSLAAFRETFKGVCPGNDVEVHNALRTLHPFYNGHIYPQI